jgi:O-antigen/teichoic acid export membrane protein
VNAEPATAVVSAGPRTLARWSVVVGAALVLANVFNAIFQFALARILEPAEYSLLAALFYVVLIAAVPTLAFQASLARELAVRLAGGGRSEAAVELRGTLRASVRWSGALLVLTAVALGPLAAAIGLHRSLPVVATSAAIAFSLPAPVVWGGLQGAGLFGSLGLAQVLVAAARLAAGLAIGLAGGGATSVMFGVAAATGVAVGAALFPLRSLLAAARGARSVRKRIATPANAGNALALTALTALTMSDLLVAKFAFSSHRAGVYASVSVGARAVLLLIPIGVAAVLFPRVATLQDEPKERQHLLGAIAAVAVVCAAATAFLWGLAGPLLDLTFGSKYHAAAPWLGPLSLAMAFYALAYIYVFHFLSLGRTRFSFVLVALLAVQIGLFASLHGRPADLIGIQIALGAAAVVAAELFYRLTISRPVTI